MIHTVMKQTLLLAWCPKQKIIKVKVDTLAVYCYQSKSLLFAIVCRFKIKNNKNLLAVKLEILKANLQIHSMCLESVSWDHRAAGRLYNLLGLLKKAACSVQGPPSSRLFCLDHPARCYTTWQDDAAQSLDPLRYFSWTTGKANSS